MKKYAVPIKYGIIGALAMCIVGFIYYLLFRQLFSSLTMQLLTRFVFFALFIFIPIWGGITFRRENGGVISFKDAFMGVFIIYALSAAGSSLTNYLIPNVVDKQYPEQLLELVKNTTRESMEKFGAPDDQIEKKLSDLTIEKFRPDMIATLRGYGISLAIGIALSLVTAAFIKRNPQAVTTPQADSTTSS